MRAERRAAGPVTWPRRLLAAAAILVAASLGRAAGSERGAAFYEKGFGADGTPVSARLGEAGTEVPASIVPCVNCHGDDGAGRPERGVEPPLITWPALTAPHGRVGRDGQVLPPYDEALLLRAVRDGIAPDGSTIDPVMPRYDIGAADAAALARHLQGLGGATATGASAGELVIGALVPRDATGAALLKTIRAAVSRVNRRGGIHGRALSVAAATWDEARGPVEALETVNAVTPLLAVVAPMAGADTARLTAFARQTGLPLIAPVGTAVVEAPLPDDPVFHFEGGIAERLAALVAGGAGDGAVRLVGSCEGAASDAARDLLEDGRIAPAPDGGPAAAVLLSSGPACAAGDIRRAAALTGGPILLPVEAMGPEVFRLPRETLARLRIAVLTVPGQLPSSARGFAELPAEARTGHQALRRHAFSAVELLVEGLSRAGRTVSRSGLIGALEKGRDMRAGFMPLQTFGPNRRAGSAGYYVTPVVPGAGKPVWVPVEG